jgi:transcriptional regulator with XRE-family HTH domain
MVKKLLGDAVREERLRRNLSQNSLAEQAKISLRTVSDIENYIGNPQLETLYALATYLHISIFSNQKTNPDSTMQQIMAELNSCPEEQKQLALSTLRGLLDGFKNLS